MAPKKPFQALKVGLECTTHTPKVFSCLRPISIETVGMTCSCMDSPGKTLPGMRIPNVARDIGNGTSSLKRRTANHPGSWILMATANRTCCAAPVGTWVTLPQIGKIPDSRGRSIRLHIKADGNGSPMELGLAM